MKYTYSLYEAKARFSKIVRQVREGQSVIVTVHGEPVAEIRPFEPAPVGLAERLRMLTERGVITPQSAERRSLSQIERRPGALQRFLDERD